MLNWVKSIEFAITFCVHRHDDCNFVKKSFFHFDKSIHLSKSLSYIKSFCIRFAITFTFSNLIKRQTERNFFRQNLLESSKCVDVNFSWEKVIKNFQMCRKVIILFGVALTEQSSGRENLRSYFLGGVNSCEYNLRLILLLSIYLIHEILLEVDYHNI